MLGMHALSFLQAKNSFANFNHLHHSFNAMNDEQRTPVGALKQSEDEDAASAKEEVTSGPRHRRSDEDWSTVWFIHTYTHTYICMYTYIIFV